MFDTVCPAEEALELARDSDTVVIETLRCTGGRQVWDDFYSRVSRGEPATVLCARYYGPDAAEEARLFFYLVEYDGEQFSVTIRDSSGSEPEQQETFKYLMHYTGDFLAQAAFSHYDYYVLVDDDTLAWEDIERGLVSSRYGDYIRHCAVYQDVSE